MGARVVFLPIPVSDRAGRPKVWVCAPVVPGANDAIAADVCRGRPCACPRCPRPPAVPGGTPGDHKGRPYTPTVPGETMRSRATCVGGGLVPARGARARFPWAIALTTPAWVSVAFVHLGCFLNGCCFGVPSATPWAVSLSKHSVVFLQQARAGWVPPEAAHTLPVEPLPLYFAALALRHRIRHTEGAARGLAL
ncbi:MAG: hypothetical protein KatS3mg077_0770 [Candidatus Binatia bacterium]|nr:MAG: hypothetical protein KatS3mg077_0770 [Candidatus Binatia bacterium]